MGKDKVNKLEFCRLKIMPIVVFYNHDSVHFSILRVSANVLYNCYSVFVDSFLFIH